MSVLDIRVAQAAERDNMNTQEVLKEFYSSREEDKRLLSKHGNVEFYITTEYIDNYLRRDDRILEIGCGAGRYALHYAHKNHRVDAIELMAEHLEVLKSNKLPDDDICAVQGNALDLSLYADETFDVTLLLGPMYHLFTLEDKLQCLREAVRVTKKGGILFVAYCQFDASMMQAGFVRNMYSYLVENHLLDEQLYVPISNPAGIFELYRKEQVDELNRNINIERLHYLGTDMFTHYYAEAVDRMDDELYQKYIGYTLSICENQNIVGVSNHTLDIMRKT